MKLGSMQQRSWLGSDDSAVMCLRFWLRQFVKKWLTFSQDGDDFNRDSDNSSEESYESEEFEDCEGELLFRSAGNSVSICVTLGVT